MNTAEKWHGTTIVLLRKGGETIVAGDGQVSLGNTVLKSKAKKVRKIESRGVIAGFAGSTADALTLFERLEAKLEKHAGNLQRAAVELAKDWRSDKFLRRLEALMAVADKNHSFIISGTGDVLEPEDGIIGIGSGLEIPEINKIAACFGFDYCKISDFADMPKTLSEVIDRSGLVICEVVLQDDERLMPKCSVFRQDDNALVSAPLEDMSPLLSLDELSEVMEGNIEPVSQSIRT